MNPTGHGGDRGEGRAGARVPHRWSARLGICLLASLASACGTDRANRPSIVDGGGDDLAAPPANDDGAPGDVGDTTSATSCLPPPAEAAAAMCNQLIVASACVDQVQVDDNAPAPAGGDLRGGDYDLTERILYTNPGGATGIVGEPLAESLSLSLALAGSGEGWTLDRVTISARATVRSSATAHVSGVTIRLVTLCPSGNTPPPVDANAGADAAPPDASVGAVYYYTSSDLGLTLYRLGPNGPVQADTYAARR